MRSKRSLPGLDIGTAGPILDCMKTILLAVALALVGCGSSSSEEPTVAHCGGGTGRTYMQAAKCTDGRLVDAWCEVHGGPAETSKATDDGGWECATTWDDPVKGGTLCIHMTCKE